MKFVIVFAALFAVALAAPATSSNDATIVVNESNMKSDSYNYRSETSDGTAKSEEGQLRKLDEERSAIVVKGSYQYVGDDGVTYSVNYIADENGFQPQGAHIPVA